MSLDFSFKQQIISFQIDSIKSLQRSDRYFGSWNSSFLFSNFGCVTNECLEYLFSFQYILIWKIVKNYFQFVGVSLMNCYYNWVHVFICLFIWVFHSVRKIKTNSFLLRFANWSILVPAKFRTTKVNESLYTIYTCISWKRHTLFEMEFEQQSTEKNYAYLVLFSLLITCIRFFSWISELFIICAESKRFQISVRINCDVGVNESRWIVVN